MSQSKEERALTSCVLLAPWELGNDRAMDPLPGNRVGRISAHDRILTNHMQLKRPGAVVIMLSYRLRG
jgi:hypothetical protein